MTIVHELRARGVEDFAIISGSSCATRTLAGLRAGVADFLVKPVSVLEIRRVTTRLLQERQNRLVGIATPVTRPLVEPDALLGASIASCGLRRAVHRAARMRPVRAVVVGPAGVDKRHVAASIHHASGVGGALVYVDCAQERDSTASARLFGRVPALPAQNPTITGHLEAAKGGTLVLDNLALLPPALQSTLRTCLDSNRFRSAGSYTSSTLECGVVGILREPPYQAMAEKRLREDLYYTLAEMTLDVPPLSKREEDVLEIAEHLLAGWNASDGVEKGLSPDYRRALLDHDWPGNVVELRAVLRAGYEATEPGGEIEAVPVFAQCASRRRTHQIEPFVGDSFHMIGQRLARATLEHTDGNKRQASRLLGISPTTLRKHLDRRSA